jgi:hypothetical protein
MSVTIRLDGAALTQLIEGDDDFKLELQRAVIAEVVKKLLLKDFGQVLNALAPQAMQELTAALKEDEGVRLELTERLAATVQSVRSGTYGFRAQKELPQETKTAIAQRVSGLVHEAIEARVGRVDKLVDEIIKNTINGIEGSIDKRIQSSVDATVARSIQTGVVKRLNELLAQLPAESVS